VVLSRPVSAAGTREFMITGSWDDPKVDKVDKPSSPPVRPARSSMRRMKIAACQMVSGPDVAANLATARRLLDQAAAEGARLGRAARVLLPDGPARPRQAGHAEPLGEGPQACWPGARELGLW
jgi:hypothetical protein